MTLLKLGDRRVSSEQSTPDMLDTLLETLDALVVVMDPEGRVVRFNEACQELTGYGADEIVGDPLWEPLVPEKQRDEVLNVFEQLRAGDFPNQHENQWMTREGERRTIAWSNSAVLDDDGDVEWVVATGVDVTEQRRAEAEHRELIRTEAAREAAEAARDSLRLSEDLFSGIVDLCADAIVSIDEDHRITLFNQGAEEIFGYTADEAIGEELEILLPEGVQQLHAAHVREFSNSDEASRRMGERGDIYGRRKNGELFPAEASISKQTVEGRWYYTAVLRDVTEARQIQDQLERSNEQLARSNEELEHFAAAASHDLQEPLRKIRAFGERLESRYAEQLPDRGRDYLERMRDAAGRMSRLIDDLLSFSRITTRAEPFEPVDFEAVLEEVVQDLEMRIERTDGVVDVGDLPDIEADRTQIRMAFQNLVANALKFHREDVPPVVEVGTEPADEPGVCRIYVEDNGAGFDEKYLDRIFDVFERLHGRGVYEGTGMGLAIVRKIVDRHGGDIEVDSTPGAGSKFTISLPVDQPEIPEGTTDEQC